MYRWLMAVLLAATTLPAAAQSKQELHLFVPCGMIIPFNTITKEFERTTGVDVRITYDNGVTLVRRIRDKHARPDIVVQPGELEILQLRKGGFIDPATITTFGTFKMVLVVSRRSRAGIEKLADLTKPGVRAIMLADPDLNSVGYYAKQVLQKAGLWDKVKKKVVYHWHAVEAVEYALSGRADATICYATCPFDSAPEKVTTKTYRMLGELPASISPVVKVQAAMLKESKNPDAARQFLQFLLQPSTQKTLARLGIPNIDGGERR